MAAQIPEEDELRSRIIEHLRARPNNPMVAAVWRGYIAGLSEWGLIDNHVYARLTGLLPEPGSTETVEIMLGCEYVDEHPELKTGA